MQKPKSIFHTLFCLFPRRKYKRNVAPKASSSLESPVAVVCRSPQRADTSSSLSLCSGSATATVLVSSHFDSLKKLVFFCLSNINVIAIVTKGRKNTARKLSVVDFSPIDSLPVRPAPTPEIAKPPMIPSNVPSPHGFTLPPCNPLHNGSPYPQIFPVQKVWCVAKPSVPEETLQQAMDYACGEGGADCMEITPQGNCYYPDTVVAHASYATATVMEEKLKEVGGVLEFKVEAGKAINGARGGCPRRCGNDLSGTAKTIQ